MLSVSNEVKIIWLLYVIRDDICDGLIPRVRLDWKMVTYVLSSMLGRELLLNLLWLLFTRVDFGAGSTEEVSAGRGITLLGVRNTVSVVAVINH